MKYEEAVASFEFGKGENYVILIHGYSGNPYEMRDLGQYLADYGFHTIAPCLPGHGQNKEALLKTGWRDWWAEVKRNIDTVKEKNPLNLFISGLSVGGTLTLYAAARYPSITAISPICAPVYTKKSYRWGFKFVKPFMTFIPSKHYPHRDVYDQNLLKDPVFQENRRRYDKEVAPAFESVLKLFDEVKNHSLSKITVPAVISQARNDRTVVPSNGSYIFNHITTKIEEKKLVWLERSGHIATVDCDKKVLFREISNFFKKFLKKKD
ncbi:MAG: alpha/beta hydrolase [Candidatus Hodarchaeota archaeon]